MKRGLVGLIAILLAGCTSVMSEGEGAGEGGTYGDNEGVRWTDGNPDFTPARSALIIPLNKTESGLSKDFNQDDNCFYSAGANLKRFYEERGASATILPVNKADTLIALLEGLAKQKKVYDRIIFNAHGGWDGPMFYRSKQVGLDWPEMELKEYEGDTHKQWQLQQYFLGYGATLNKVLSAKGWIWVGSCNSSTEGKSLFGATRYTDAMACSTNRMTYGVATKTACWDVEDRVKKLEQGIKTPMIWRSNPANLPAQMLCFGESMPPYPPPFECIKDEHCPAMNICTSNKCQPVECIKNEHCPAKNICASNKCQPVDCVTDDHCPAKNICRSWSNKCEEVECVTKDHCPTGNVCTTWNKCEPAPPASDAGVPLPADGGAPPSPDGGVPQP